MNTLPAFERAVHAVCNWLCHFYESDYPVILSYIDDERRSTHSAPMRQFWIAASRKIEARQNTVGAGSGVRS